MISEHSRERILAYRINVTGRVQGVGFRYSAQQRAVRLGLTGWVRNERDGSVGIFCEGAAVAVAAFITWLEDGGPAGSRITHIEKNPAAANETFSRFTIEY